jgi:hypothetical protein
MLSPRRKPGSSDFFQMLDSGWNHAGMTTKDPLNEYNYL